LIHRNVGNLLSGDKLRPVAGADMFANVEMVDRIAGAGTISLAIAIFGFCPSCVVPGLKTRQAKGAG
jgi:hypothetical protein